jgi:sigma-B regulation protein RsbU (phosphoserine phosphatase)
VFYTDGVTEAMNMNNEMFGMDRLINVVKNLKGCSSEEVASTVQREVAKYAGKAPQHDDITVLAIRT